MAHGGAFEEPQPLPRKFGMLIGAVYRQRVVNIPIPGAEGLEVYPTIEIIDRLYAPLRQEHEFPIPVEITTDDLESALAGKFVTRVVYLEDPESPLPVANRPREQRWIDVGPQDNPLEMADELGRPMAILRLGGRLPGSAGPDDAFLYGSPPMMVIREKPRSGDGLTQSPDRCPVTPGVDR
jgi:hypothetical protein